MWLISCYIFGKFFTVSKDTLIVTKMNNAWIMILYYINVGSKTYKSNTIIPSSLTTEFFQCKLYKSIDLCYVPSKIQNI
jgi:hypothetical protein